jgi:nicotinamide phosphoribosyltransferase
MRKNPLLMTDGYKTSHHKMMPEGTTLVYSNFTLRNVKYMPEKAKEIVVFGQQYVMKYIHDLYQENFFNQPKEIVINEVKEYLTSYLGCEYDTTHFEELYDLGYLPINVKSLPEGMVIGEKIPILTIYNTHPNFFWLPNFLETLISSLLWKPVHSASIAYGYKQVLMEYALKTDKDNVGFVNFQGHDFSFRGMQHLESAISSGLGFLTSFYGTDTIPALQAAKYYYDSSNIGFSVPASEHSVMTSYGKEDEIVGFKRLMRQFPSGILSIVSDSFNLWDVCTKFMVELKDEIMARDGKLVIRPDSGNPVDILCGVGFEESGKYYKYNRIPQIPGEEKVEISKSEHKGVIELLWDVFGGTVNEQGYKVLDSHIGAIYGDSITIDRADEICSRLETKGFASTNVVLGVGSYSMGYATRDNQGGAIKATYVEVMEQVDKHGVMSRVGREIFKDPITDDGTKKSATGLLCVTLNEEKEIQLVDKVDWETECEGLLETIYQDGEFFNTTTFEEIRNRLK